MGLSFLQIGFLAAGAAAAIPVLIHLLFRQRARQLSIGSIRFLQSVVREHHRRKRVRQWLLLALRCLAALLLALLFARPFINAAAQHGAQHEVVLLIDSSASMSSRETGGNTPYAQALQMAQDEIRRLDENVILHLGSFDATGVRRIKLPELAATSPGKAATDYGLALSWARDVLANSKRAQRRVVLITDMQQTGIGKTAFDQLPPGVEFLIHDVGHAVSANMAILSVEAVRSEIRPKESVLLRALVYNFAPLPAHDVQLEVRLNGPAGVLNVDLPVQVDGGSATTVDIPLDVSADGLYSGQVQLQPPDSIDWDNTRWVAFEARHPDRVLLVDGQVGQNAFANETYYLETALRLRTMEGATGLRSFEVEKLAWEAGSGFPNLAGFRALVLANIRDFSPADIDRLAKYVMAGGNALLFAGDQSKPSDFDELAAAGVFPGTVKRTPVTEPLRVTDWDKKHVALLPFADPQHGDLRRLEFRRTLPLEALAENGQALLTAGPYTLAAERNLGSGRFVYVGTSADRDWSNWPQTRLYVPLVRQWMAYLTAQLSDRSRVSTQLIAAADQQPGIELAEGTAVVRNIDSQESVPDRVTKDQLCRALNIAETRLAPEEQAQRAAIALPSDAQRADEIWTIVAWCLLATLAAESLLASRVHA